MAAFSELGWVYIGLLILFAAIFLAVLVALVRGQAGGAKAKIPPPPPAESGTLAGAMATPGAVPDPYMLRFVVDEKAERVGETLSMTDKHVIIKREGAFHAVPLAQVTIESGELIAREVDWEAAQREGEAWREHQASQHDAIHFDNSPEAAKE